MATMNFQVSLIMSAYTVSCLAASGFFLYGFKAVRSADQACRPLVWFKTADYSALTTVCWREQVQAYTSTSYITANNFITAGFSTDIAPGQTLDVLDKGLGVLVASSQSVISIFNTTHTRFTCGLQQAVGGIFSPLCALPLYGGTRTVIAPSPRILLVFSTGLLRPGTVVESWDAFDGTTGPGILIELTDSHQRDVTYDINSDWSWNSQGWARHVAAHGSLSPWLIETPDRMH
jgi:hypothetical protein